MNDQQIYALFRQIEANLYQSQKVLGVSRGKAVHIFEQLLNTTHSPEKAQAVILVLLAHVDERDLGRIYKIFESEKLI